MIKSLSFLLSLILMMSLCSCGEEAVNTSSTYLPLESEQSDVYTVDESSCEDTSSQPEQEIEFNAKTDLLPLFNGLSEAETERALSFFAYVEESFGTENLISLTTDIKEKGYDDNLWYNHFGNSIHVLRSLFKGEDKTMENMRLLNLGQKNNKTTVMTFGGDVCFGDNYYPIQRLNERENGLYDCFDKEWFDVMQNADIAMLNNEFTISSRGEPMPKKLYTFRSKPENTRYYNDLGVDFVTLANNHAFDYGEDAFYDTMDILDEYNIDYAGGGKNAEEAQRPFYYLVNGRKIAFLSATRAEKYILTPEAGENTPGVFRCYDPQRLIEVIGETKQNCDFLVLFVHWGTEYSPVLEKVQETTSHDYIDAGADLIIGSHAHQLQGIEFYKGKAIFYNLGNFWFNGKKIETGLVKLNLDNDGNAEYYFLPGLQYKCKTSYELGTELGRTIMDHIASYQPNISIADDGLVKPKS